MKKQPKKAKPVWVVVRASGVTWERRIYDTREQARHMRDVFAGACPWANPLRVARLVEKP